MAAEAKPVLGQTARIRGAKASVTPNQVAQALSTYVKDTYFDGTEGTDQTFVVHIEVKPIGV